MTLPVSVVLHQVRSLYNVGSFFRTADGAGVREVVLSGITARPPRKEIAKTALGAEDSVPWVGVDDLPTWMDAFERAGGQLAAIETTPGGVDLYDWAPRWPVAVFFGHEVEGLAAEVATRCHVHVRIPMQGVKGSLNVATAGGVVLYELLRKHRSGLKSQVSRQP
ncbi:TrmH family RNA methyltransferase [Luteitalea pratensis]|uniref:TrmH family RNA methyltransferase n=1 Tax=Luteitalea pratensis TaxID=1855912 RepID=UPI001F1E1C5A|nr:TrmH family RNA methyltransferase [Luteitalea pratensis]